MEEGYPFADGIHISKWYKWFAWRPVRVNHPLGPYRWFRYVAKRDVEDWTNPYIETGNYPNTYSEYMDYKTYVLEQL